MSAPAATIHAHQLDGATSIIELAGHLTPWTAPELLAAHAQASGPATRTILLDFGGLEYICGGIAALVSLLIHARQRHQRVLAFQLRTHHHQILALSGLSRVIEVHSSEAAALHAAFQPQRFT